MTLPAGTRLGPYEVVAPLGAGGMGEVYRAQDTRLERTVAIKVLPQHLSASPESRQRFEREAKTISQLSHPHVCALYDVGNQDGVEYLVMEYLEGETLADRLLKGPLPTEQTLRYGIEMADALDKAHRRGIVHRDLKPGNVMLTKSGVKLLDFGLAKLAQPASSASALTSLPTEAPALTAEGTLLGTFQYMAPEQLEGKEADVRTDIFAFGAVLYEMATGRKAFSGRSRASLIGAILKDEPAPISTVQPMTPSALDRAVKTCLAKDPEERFQTAHDVGMQLKWIAEGGSGAGLLAPVAARKSRLGAILIAGLFGFVVAAVLAWPLARAFLSPRSLPARPPTRFALATPPGTAAMFVWNDPLALSPDGRILAASLLSAGGTQLFLHSFDQLSWTPVGETENNLGMEVFSPDSQWIAFVGYGKLKKVAVHGGMPLTVCESGGITYGISWGPDDTLWFGSNAGLMKVSAAGGTPQVAVPVQAGDSSLRFPRVLPGGKAVLFVAYEDTGRPDRIEAFSLETWRRKVLVQAGYYPRYAGTGHLIYTTEMGAALLAVPFDSKRLEVKGSPAPVLEEGATRYDFAENGTLVYLPAGASQSTKLVWVDRSGKVQPLPAPSHYFEQPRLSPDGRSVAVASREGNQDVWIYGLDRGTLLRLTLDPAEDETPIWTPDGKRVAFRRGGKIFWKASDGSGAEELLATSNLNWHLGSFSPDGRAIVLNAFGNGEDILTVSLDGKSTLRPFLQTPSNEKAPAISPDGHWLAYSSDETGLDEVYVQAFPGPGGRLQVSTGGGSEPVWARGGRELFYRNGDRMMSVDVRTEPSFTATAPRALFEGKFARGHRGHTNYDVSPDGQRFLMIQGMETALGELHIVLDWFTELVRRVPVK